MKARTVVFGLALALLLLPVAAKAQTAQVGQLGGEVKDTSGGALPGATVAMKSEERGFVRTTVTDGQGRYLFTVVSLGRYAVTVTLQGFQTKTVTGNLVEAEKTTTVNVVLEVGAVTIETSVVGETPIVDPANQTQQTRIRADEFQKMPFGRSYQTLLGQTPGVVGTGNVNALGSTTGNNLFLFDGVNTTDPTTGTFGTNLNFEAIQEVVIRTSAVSVDFGRATGAIVDVITKSGTNKYEASYKYIITNDDWNAQNTTKSEVSPFASLARTKFDHINPIHNVTAGGPVLENKIWFFFVYENAKNTTPQRQTNAAPGFTNENFQQTTTSSWPTFRVNTQIAPNHGFWFKANSSPTDGFIVDYWGNSAELFALTAQDQGGTQYAGQYTGVFRSRWTVEAMAAAATEFINVRPYRNGPLEGGAPFTNLSDGRSYNGATFDGKVDRPRQQVTAAASYFTTMGRATHAFKFGVDYQHVNSENEFKYPTGVWFRVLSFNPVTREHTPSTKRVYQVDPSKSDGSQTAFYVRDKIQFKQLSLEAGLRVEHQGGESDVGVPTVDTTTVAPRLSGSWALTDDAKTIILGSWGRFHDAILQNFSDSFGAVPQQTNYDNFVWDGTQYVFSNRVELGASTFKPDTAVTPRYLDEWSIGFQRQESKVIGWGVRYVDRDWSNFIDDVLTFNPDGSIKRIVANVAEADRTYRGVELTFEKRLSNNYTFYANYTYARTKANHFATQGGQFTAVGDFLDANCRQTADTGLGDVNGVFPCADVQANLMGKPAFDRPHAFKFGGAYTRPFGPVDLTAGLVGSAISNLTYTPTRTVNVLLPGTLTNAGPSLGYNYLPLGSNRIDGLATQYDLSIEALYRAIDEASIGFKAEIFNLFNSESKINVNNTAWCRATTTAACQTAVANFGTATARGSFQTPRNYRFMFIVRFFQK